MDLSIINTIAIIIIIIVVIINFTITAKNYKNIKQNADNLDNLTHQMSEYIDYLENAIKQYIHTKLEQHTTNVLDLDEFSTLNPELKELYKTQIIQNLMPALMGAVNNEYLDKNSNINEASITNAIKDLANKLRKDGLTTKTTPMQLEPMQQEPMQPMQQTLK
jgi:hypothetical protein